jgi:hypothetical protein
MQMHAIVKTALALFLGAALATGCAGMTAKPSAETFKAPAVTLSHAEVPYYTGFWHYDKTAKPFKGKEGANGAPLMLAFVFDIGNPNAYPVMLENLKFSVYFEDFEVNTVSSMETMWIPAGKSNQLRVPAMFDTQQTSLTLMLPGAMKVKALGVTPWDLLEKWWTKAPDFGFPVAVREGSAVFKADNLTQVVPFAAKYP